MLFGGFSTTSASHPLPVGAELLAAGSSAWRIGDHPAHVLAATGHHRVLVLGHCGAREFELSRLNCTPPPANVAWRWPGAYVVVEEGTTNVVVHTDPAAARPVYAARWNEGWAWSTSARFLASLNEASIDVERLACAVFLPSVPALVGNRSFFDGVRQLPPGSRIELPADGSGLRFTTRWRPDPVPDMLPDIRLKDALERAVTLRVVSDPALSCDLSGGLDSTSITVLAATAQPSDRRLNAVTVHPDGDLGGADLHHARLTAARHTHRVAHCLLPLTDRHLPYTAITEVPATDEPAPSTLTHTRLTGQLDWMHAKLGTRTHLTGDGGDSVLFQPPIRLADLIRRGRGRRAVTEAFGWARLRHSPVGPLLWDAALTARTSRREALTALADMVGAPDRDDHGRATWFSLLPFPSWATPRAAGLLTRAARRIAAQADPLAGLDFSVRVLVDEIREVARTAASDAQLAAVCDVDLHNPFLDPIVVDAVLTAPLLRRPPLYAYKPTLARAMAHLLPSETAKRTTKGSFDADHYTGMRVNLPALSALADGNLAALGLVHPALFRRHLAQASAGLPMPLATLEQALTVEAWLTAHHRDPVVAWTHAIIRKDSRG
ncbi:albusnodin/ikarugamycin family macrolactam cyclase [Kitasatospora sp. NPDC002965]|uniref:albusnodin/ikarugamycin family macrolactam cyclase n=1 Tax=Kitasatospora sp. NPDC002965 TaxID=3154775 RepID=UPI0033B6E3AA